MGNKVYTATFSQVVAVGATWSSNLQILSPGRDLQIKSIFLDIRFTDNGSGRIIPWRYSSEQIITLIVGNFTDKMALPFVIAGGTPPAFNGNYLRKTDPGQINFDSFFVSELLPVNVQGSNLSAGTICVHDVTVTIEIAEKSTFQ